MQHDETTGEHLGPRRLQLPARCHRCHIPSIQQGSAQTPQSLQGNPLPAPAFACHHILNRLDRTRRTGDDLPAKIDILLTNRLQPQLHPQLSFAQPVFSDLTIGETGTAQADATHLEAGQMQWLEFFTDDQFRATTTNIDDQPPTGYVGNAVRDTEIDQARLFLAANDLDGVAEHIRGTDQKICAVARLPQGVGADDPQTLGRNMAQTLTKTRQTLQRSLLRFLR